MKYLWYESRAIKLWEMLVVIGVFYILGFLAGFIFWK